MATQWTVDVGVLPSFQRQASIPNNGGFYTGALLGVGIILSHLLTIDFSEFKLGLSVDSAEVRGVLIDGTQIIGDVVFDFLS